jgi:hypothetical protein
MVDCSTGTSQPVKPWTPGDSMDSFPGYMLGELHNLVAFLTELSTPVMFWVKGHRSTGTPRLASGLPASVGPTPEQRAFAVSFKPSPQLVRNAGVAEGTS